MKMNSQKTVLKCVGAALAVGSAIAMASSTKAGNCSTKKTMKKTANKVADFVDTVASFM